MAAARVVGIALLVILLFGAELVAVPEARQLVQQQRAGSAVTGGRRPASGKWNRGWAVGGDKRSVPGGPDPQHHG
ncbi:hypothetical protein BS78_09G201900 [Paspalum vaginatum]|nr:hypothetical protein BS78_09G201900 [Paspalum vaginatum]